jgi:hypothetical protein
VIEAPESLCQLEQYNPVILEFVNPQLQHAQLQPESPNIQKKKITSQDKQK